MGGGEVEISKTAEDPINESKMSSLRYKSTVNGPVSMHPEPEFLNIYWRLKSRLFEESCLFKCQSVQKGSQWLQFFCILKIFLCQQFEKTKNR